MTTVLLVIIAVILFGLIIFLHELGHFLTAKLSGIKINEFSIGMGPKLLSFGKKETKYTLRLFPIGGFCAMEGEDDDSEDDRAFSNKPVWKRMIVVAAGAIMNIIFGFVLMAVVLCQQNLLGTNQVADFAEGSKLEEAGAEVGDYIVSIDGYSVSTDRDLSFGFAFADPADGVDVTLSRNGEKIELDNVPFDTVVGETGRESVTMDFYIYGEQKTFLNVAGKTFMDTGSVIRMVFASLGGIVSGKFGFNDLSGPVGAAQAITQAASAGLSVSFMSAVNNIIIMMCVISVNLGIFNLLPLPALDGGRFVFLIIEAIRKKPVPQKYEAYVNAAGFILLIALMVAITFKDVWGLFT